MPKPDRTPDPLNPLGELWQARAHHYGKRCVIDLAIPEDNYDAMTRFQWEVFRPALLDQFDGRERSILDYGCGPGRFTSLIGDIAPHAHVLGYDPCRELVYQAPSETNRVFFRNGEPSDFFALGKRFDTIFIALVLGGLPDAILPDLAIKLITSLAPTGLLFFAEHTDASNQGNSFWHFRTENFYESLFKNPHGGLPPVLIKKIGSYTTRGNQVSIFAGRKALG